MTVPSPSSGKCYPVKLLCEVLAVPRSSLYASLSLGNCAVLLDKRGPKTAQSDEALLDAIRADLAASCFLGEGHRKVWARLRRAGIHVSRKRVLRVMRQHQLLAPTRRVHPHGDKAHEGTIIAAAPDQLWGTDGTRFVTEQEGGSWVFLAVDHFNDEIVGWHVCKRGDRFAALEPIRQGVRARFGVMEKRAAQGLALRMDNGPQYLAEDFRNELKFWGIDPSPTFVGEPEGNGIVERVIGLLKEQCLWGQRWLNLEEARIQIGLFVARYNAQWLIERLGFRAPVEARLDWQAGLSLC